jgi:3-oxoadipate enol-lactonase
MIRLYHRLEGPAGAPVVVLGPSIGTTTDLWEPQLGALTESWQVLRYDLPGHGRSAVGPGTVDDLADALAVLLDDLGVDRVAYGGVSLGGAVGTTLALRHPERVASLVLCCTSARFGEPESWHERAAKVRAAGIAPLTGMFLGRWFACEHFDTHGARAMLATVDAEGYAACCEALAAFDVRDRLGDVRAPTLVIAGQKDIATPLDHAEELVRGIAGAELVVIRDAAHLANLEQPGPVTAAMVDHLERTFV